MNRTLEFCNRLQTHERARFNADSFVDIPQDTLLSIAVGVARRFYNIYLSDDSCVELDDVVMRGIEIALAARPSAEYTLAQKIVYVKNLVRGYLSNDLRQRRKRGKREREYDVELAAQPKPSDRSGINVYRRYIDGALDALQNETHRAVVLRYMDGAKNKDIASEYGVSVSLVQMIKTRFKIFVLRAYITERAAYYQRFSNILPKDELYVSYKGFLNGEVSLMALADDIRTVNGKSSHGAELQIYDTLRSTYLAMSE